MDYEKSLELVIRADEDKRKLEELLAAGWEIKNHGTVAIPNEPTRSEYHLYLPKA